jgi:hypothetical protein
MGGVNPATLAQGASGPPSKDSQFNRFPVYLGAQASD